MGFEFVSAAYVRKHNRMECFIPHPKHGIQEGHYTDDTQMALALAEHMLSSKPWTAANLATSFAWGFGRDPREGYSKGFHQVLSGLSTSGDSRGLELLSALQPRSTRNGGAMRAFPVGFLLDMAEVRDRAMQQAALTHATWEGMAAAAAAALMFHHRYHRIGFKKNMETFLTAQVPGIDWSEKALQTPVPVQGIATVRAALHAYIKGHSLMDVIQIAVSFGGDTDSVAAIAAPIAAVCSETRNAVPPFMLDGLENGPYGKDYLILQDEALRARFQPRWWQTSPAEVLSNRPPPTRRRKAPEPKPRVVAPDEGPLDFLFDGE